MPPADYTGVIGGGLRFKGSSKVTKPKKPTTSSIKPPRPPKPEDSRDEDEAAARPSAARRASDRTKDDNPERPDVERRRASGQSGEPPQSLEPKGPSPSQERVRSADPKHASSPWRTPALHSSSSLDPPTTSTTNHGEPASGSRNRSLENPTESIAEALRAEGWSSKTEAERRHEERRKRRLEERLRREGVRTHKERVEEFNRRLARESEHHDMPRIGPG